jgi:hypothetical protein
MCRSGHRCDQREIVKLACTHLPYRVGDALTHESRLEAVSVRCQYA